MPSHVFTAYDISPDRLADFLRRVYPPLKAEFLIQHGEWWHGSNDNRLVIEVDGQIAGYCAVIPAQVWVGGQKRAALWWVDLILGREFRGRGLQTLFDQRVRGMADLLLGFPNALAAKIHRKHGWGVREDLPLLLLPLWPRQVKPVRSAVGRRGTLLRAGALALSPLAAAWRGRLRRLRPRRAWKLEAQAGQERAAILAGIFERHLPQGLNTTWREAEHFRWRYAQAPQPEEYAIYLAGEEQAPSAYLVARHITQPGGPRYTRILDVFGDFTQTEALQDLLLLAVQDALRRGCGQATLLATRPELRAAAQRLGFLLPAQVGFCWLSRDVEVQQALGGENYWTLGDSDNDAPD
jgi:hypothetical protein